MGWAASSCRHKNGRRDLPLLDEVRKHKGATCHLPVVKGDESGGANENRGDGQKDASSQGLARKRPAAASDEKRQA